MHQYALKPLGKPYAFWRALNRVVKEVPENKQLFVLMSANARTGRRGEGGFKSKDCKVVGAAGRGTLNDNVERLLSFFADHDLHC